MQNVTPASLSSRQYLELEAPLDGKRLCSVRSAQENFRDGTPFVKLTCLYDILVFELISTPRSVHTYL